MCLVYVTPVCARTYEEVEGKVSVHFIINGLSLEAGLFPKPGARLEASNTQDCFPVHHTLGYRCVVLGRLCDLNSASVCNPCSVSL